MTKQYISAIAANKRFGVIYNVVISVLAVVSIVMAIAEICGKVSADNPVYHAADITILAVFAVDYIVRFVAAPSKSGFFKSNIFDLIAILPLSSALTFFRFARLLRLAKFTRLFKLAKFARIIGFVGRLRQQLYKFLRTNGFIYMLYTAGALIILSSILISYFEGKPFGDALWWAIVTCTTVGYGDISPSTGVGRVIAVVLMIFGIGLISMLTGTITTFFADHAPKSQDPSNDDAQDIAKEIEKMDDEKRAQLIAIIKILNK